MTLVKINNSNFGKINRRLKLNIILLVCFILIIGVFKIASTSLAKVGTSNRSLKVQESNCLINSEDDAPFDIKSNRSFLPVI